MEYRKLKKSVFFFTLMLQSVNVLSSPAAALRFQAPQFNNLGSFHYPIATHNPHAQKFYDQGMTLYYGFEWSEAVRSFKESSRLDPTCAMCFWGEALALSNKINAPMTGHEEEEGQLALKNALKFKDSETDAHQAIIAALIQRYKHAPPKKHHGEVFSCHGASSDDPQSQAKIAYANAMKKVVERFNENAEAKVLLAGAVFWSVVGTHPAGYQVDKQDPRLVPVTKLMETVLKKDPQNVGANHYYIHLIEPYANPARGLKSAGILRTLVPGSEHLVHMPAHIYFLTGRYHDATLANQQAINVYNDYNIACHKQGFIPEINYLYFHNYDFLRTSAIMEGRKEIAVKAAKQLLADPYPSWMKKAPDLQFFMPIELFVYARFGMWDEILKASSPKANADYALGLWHYARGLAFVHLHQLQNANKEYAALKKMISHGKTEGNLGEKGQSTLILARTLLSAALEDLNGHHEEVIKQLQIAVKLQDNMGYHEPPDWYFPIKETLAEAYLKQGEYKLATLWYKKDLQQYPNNGWALYGLQQSLQKQGQMHASQLVAAEFKKSWKNADIPRPIAFFA